MTIDENGQQSLTKYKGGVVKTDHNRLEIKVDLVFHKKEKEECLTVRNSLCQKTFYEYTSKTKMFTRCFSNYKGMDANFQKWTTCFQKYFFASFKKVRVKNSEPKESKMDELMNLKNKSYSR